MRRHYFAGGLDLLGLWQCILAPVNPSTLEGFSFGLPAPPLGAYWPAWPLSCQRAAYGGTAETRSSGRAKRLAAVARSERPQRAWAVPAARSTAGSCLSSLWSRGGRQPQIAVVSAEWPANYTLWLFVHAKKRLVWRAASGGPALLVRKYAASVVAANRHREGHICPGCVRASWSEFATLTQKTPVFSYLCQGCQGCQGI